MPRQSTSKGATIQVRVSDVLKDDIELYARDRGMTVAEFVRYCVWTYMDSTPSDENEEVEENVAESERQLDASGDRGLLEIVPGSIKHGDEHKEFEDKLDASLRRHTGKGLDDFQELAK